MDKITVLCVPLCSHGHVNPMIAIASALKKKGHRIVFTTEFSWKGKLEKWGFEEELYEESEPSTETVDKSKERAKQMIETSKEFKLPVIERPSVCAFHKFFSLVKYSNNRMLEIVSKVKPDIIIDDLLVFMPALLSTNAPIIKLLPMQPLYALVNDKLPPVQSGLPLNDNTDWESHKKIIKERLREFAEEINTWTLAQNPKSPKQHIWKAYLSTNLNIYMYPKAAVVDYLERCDLGNEWIGLDHCIRRTVGDFEIPAKLKGGTGKMIYVSLGSLGSGIVEIMTRLTTLLSNSKHKFIVVQGALHDEYTLPDNMWGEAFLPQLVILPHVDLVITHGGNNTFVETLYFGKPMIVFPLFGDQFGNAQRAVEMKIGYRFDPYTVREDELNEAIDALLYDNTVQEKLKKISQDMQESKQMEKVVEKIEFVAKNPKFPTLV